MRMQRGRGNELTIAAIGDSQGAVRVVSGGADTLDKTTVALVARRKGYANVVNAHIAGNTTAQMAARFATDVLGHRPGAVVIQGGANDWTTNISGGSWVGSGTTVATTKANLKGMVQDAQAARARVTLLTPNPIRQAVYTDNVGSWITAMQEIATETSCELIDVYTAMIGMSTETLDSYYIAGDTDHLNTVGHAYVATLGTGNAWGQM